MKGQLSAEMLILIAVIIAVVAIAATRLISTAESSSKTVEKNSNDILEQSEKAIASNQYCDQYNSCKVGQCVNSKCQ